MGSSYKIPAILTVALALSCFPSCGGPSEAEKEKIAEQTKRAISKGTVKRFSQSDYNHLLTEKARTQGTLPSKLFLSVTGEIKSKVIKQSEGSSEIRIVLKPWPDSEVDAVCAFSSSYEPYVEGVKVGETISVAGKLWLLSTSDFNLRGCVPSDGL